MRSRLFLFAAPLVTILAAPAALAQNVDEVTFVSGTGDGLGISDDAMDVERAESNQPGDSVDDSSLEELADKMTDRNRQDGIADSVERMSAALLGMRVGPLVAAIEDVSPGTVRRGVRRDTTVGDLAGRDSAYLPEELGARSREMMGMMGGFAQAMAGMIPELKQMGREMEASIRAAKDQSERN